MIFDDWASSTYAASGLTRGSFFEHNPVLADLGGVYSGDYTIAGDVSGGDHFSAGLGDFSAVYTDAYGSLSSVDTVFHAPFLVSDAPISSDLQPAAASHSSFAASYSMRMLIDSSGGQSSSFSRLGWF